MLGSLSRDADSDYGSDFASEDEQTLIQFASGSTLPPRSALQPSAVIDSVPGKTDSVGARHSDLEGENGCQTRHRPSSASTGAVELPMQATSSDAPPVYTTTPLGGEVLYPDLSRALQSVEPVLDEQSPAPESPHRVPEEDDDRSPLQRFRSFPKRPLTVSDLTSGAWCELQYWYTLTRLPGGRRTRTAAMRQGSKVHKKLEDDVHTTVKVDILSREDAFGLRLWNVVQGLRTLRETGLTRELEVWGVVDDNLVNGVIDSVSYENPNAEFEQELSSQGSQVDAKQTKLADYFPPKKRETQRPLPKMYLTDVKTRGSLAPVSNVLLRPAKIQLLLYHRFLSDMAAGRLDYFKVFRRYGLDPDDAFSDTFLAQIGGLHDEIFHESFSSQPSQPDSDADTSVDNVPDLVRYSCLRELLPLVLKETQLTFPVGEESLGHMLRVEYIYRKDGRTLDVHDFPVSKQALDMHLASYMAWWRGERAAKGVDIEESFKCGTCEFGSDCTWRQAMHDERVQKSWQKVLAARQAQRT